MAQCSKSLSSSLDDSVRRFDRVCSLHPEWNPSDLSVDRSEMDLVVDSLPAAIRPRMKANVDLLSHRIERTTYGGHLFSGSLRDSPTDDAREARERRVVVARSLLCGLSKRHGDGWTDRVLRSAIVADAISPEVAERYLACGLRGGIYVRMSDGEPVAAQERGSRCRCRWCDSCQDKVGRSMRAGIERIAGEMQWPSMLTLTVRHSRSDALEDLLSLLLRSWTRLRRSKLFAACRGGIKVVEIKRTGDGWHPHLHLLIDCKWLPHDVIRDKWRELTSGAEQIDIRRIKSSGHAASYVAKYLTKPAALHGELAFAEFVLATHNRRMVSTFGDWHNVAIVNDPEDLDELDPEPDAEWKPVGSFECVMQDANAGSPFARRVLELLLGEPLFVAKRNDSPSLNQCSLDLFPGDP